MARERGEETRMKIPVVMPQLGLTMTEGSVASWLKMPGEVVGKGEMLFVVSTDKPDMEVECLEQGRLAKIVVEPGKVVPVGTVIADLEKPGEEAAAGQKENDTPVLPPKEVPQPQPDVSDAPPVVSRQPADPRGGPPASPRARRLAKELGVDIALVKASGSSGRIVEEDVRRFVENSGPHSTPIDDREQRQQMVGRPPESLAQRIVKDRIEPGSLGIYWLAQAGFVFKTPAGKIAYVDPYISELVERVAGFKRMMTCPIKAEEVEADLVVTTHEHPDHLDTDALPIIARNPRAHFVGPVECYKEFLKLGISEDRCHLLEEGKEIDLDRIRAIGTFADHGDLAPDALGVVLDLDGFKVFHTGDTAFRRGYFQPVIDLRPNVLIPCINGRYGNLNSEEAALLTRDINPRLAIASHFWMFVEHNGDPCEFLAKCADLAPSVEAIVMKPGERWLYRKS